MTAMTEHSPEAPVEEMPGVGYALVGCAIGLLLIFIGTRIQFRILSYAVIGIGVLFVIVMTSYTLAVIWQSASGPSRRLWKRARGHVRTDPHLGALTRDVAAGCWTATVMRGDRTVDIVIRGDDQPDPLRIRHARALLTDFDELQRRVERFLELEAEDEASEDPNLADEIRALRISRLNLWYHDQPDHVEIEFEPVDESRYWSCRFVDGVPSALRVDS